MAKADSLAVMAEKKFEFLDTEVDLTAGFWKLEKKRVIEMHKSSDICVNWSLGLTVSFRLFQDGHKTVNEAEVFLFPDELPIFTRALIEHPILLPTRYSQHLSMGREMYCIRLRSQEPFEDFATRLSEALHRLEYMTRAEKRTILGVRGEK